MSLRGGTVGINKAGQRRYLKQIPVLQRPPGEHYTTIRLHDYQAHHIQRTKALTNSFAQSRCTLAWDEVWRGCRVRCGGVIWWGAEGGAVEGAHMR